MDSQYSNLTYVDPKKGVWKALYDSVMKSLLSRNPSSRRRRPESKVELEYRQAALFAFGRASLARDVSLRFAMVQDQHDSVDTILRFGSEPGSFSYEHVQLKELVPNTVDPKQTLNGLLGSIRQRYCSGEKLTIAVHMNRDHATTLGPLQTHLSGVTFWLFGLSGRNHGFIVRDPFAQFSVHEFEIPKPPSSLTQW